MNSFSNFIYICKIPYIQMEVCLNFLSYLKLCIMYKGLNAF